MVAEEDNPESWRQVAALGAMADAVKDQRSRLAKARDSLMQAWPPTQNSGAEAFVRKMNLLLISMDDTKHQADTNAAALGHVLETLRKAKETIRPLYDDYLKKSDDLLPGWWDHAEDDLDEQARKAMIQAEQAIAPQAEKIAAPEPYKFDVDKTLLEPGSKPFPTSGSSSSTSASSAPSTSVAVPHNPPPPLPGSDAYLPVTGGPGFASGPGLAGVVGPTQPSPLSPPVPPSTPAPTPQIPSGVLPPVPIAGGGRFPGGLGIPSNRGSVGGFGPFGGGQPRGMPSGAVIGGRPSAGPTPRGGPATPSWLPGGQGSGAPGQRGSGGVANGAVAGSGGMLGSQQHGKRSDATGEQFDPDNPWATAEGVAPVIEPSRHEHRHDPGPNVIGWHG
jgi:hypothetical protein